MLKFAGCALALSVLVAVAGCGGGGGGGGDGAGTATTPTPTPTPTVTPGTITGVVVSNATGQPIAGANVSAGAATVTTGTDGSYTLPNVAPSARTVLEVSAPNYALGSKVTAVFEGDTSRVDVTLLPVAYSTTIGSLASPQTVAMPGSPAQVQLSANSLVTASGGAPSGSITASITPVDPSGNQQVMPGDYSGGGSQIESYGAVEIRFRDASGAALNVAAGSSSTVRIPVAAVHQGTTPPPATMGLYSYNTSTGEWVNEGTLVLGGTAPNQYYQGTVTHFSYWNADRTYDTTCITGKVVDVNGSPVANARVESEGRNYVGTSTAYSGPDGTFTIRVKANASAILTAKRSNTQSNSATVATGAAGTNCTPMVGNLVMGALAGTAKIKLTWTANPSDLDSHLTGPNAANPTTRFHVYYSSRGSQTAAPYAELDIDDVSGFGPEIITINRFTPGVYRYSVHHYSGSGTIASSPARVELTLNGVTRVFVPPAVPAGTTLGANSVWRVMELNVDTAGNVTVTPLNSYLTNVSSFSVSTVQSGPAGKPPLAGGDW
jgi:hypothetical protein